MRVLLKRFCLHKMPGVSAIGGTAAGTLYRVKSRLQCCHCAMAYLTSRSQALGHQSCLLRSCISAGANHQIEADVNTCSAADSGIDGSCSRKVPSRSRASGSMGLYEAAVSAVQVLLPRPCCPA